ASERRLRLALDTAPALIWETRPDGYCEAVNQHYLDYVGLELSEIVGWGWTVALHPEDAEVLAETWRRLISTQSPGVAEARLRGQDGTYRWFLFRANPLRDENGKIISWYGVNTDIDDRKRAEEALRRSETLLAESERISHTGSSRSNQR